MKKKIKSYLNGIWGEEILIVLFLTITLAISYYKVFNNNFSKIGAGVFDALFHEYSYEQGMVYYDSSSIAEHVYSISNNLENMAPVIQENKGEYSNNSDFDDVNYAFINKETKQIVTNDNSLKEYFRGYSYNNESVESFIETYIKNKGYIFVSIDNIKKFNYYKTFVNTTKNSSMQNYEEIYYKYPWNYSYMIKTDAITAKIMIAVTILIILITLKIIINLIIHSNRRSLQIKSIKKFAYVLRYGFKYKYTRNKIIASFIGAVAMIIIYLYLVAGIRSKNILLTFLERYPFKGTLVIILIPLISVIYSLKKTLDISVINDALKKVNDGDLEYNLDNVGENEIKELVNNINKIKEGYKIAVEDKLRNERFKTELISNVSHDLKTPLTSIINYVNILKNDNITEEERMEYLCILEKKSLKLKVLIEDLFEISKLNSGKMTLNKNQLDIVSLIHQGVGEYCSLYEEKNIVFKVNSNKEEIFVEIDGKLMSRLFENIIINALKYSLANTRVYVDINEEDTFVKIICKNIANYEMNFDTEEILEKFVRADKSRTSSVEGSGMGLAISKSIVELHNGDMKIEVEGDMFKSIILIPK